MIDFGIFAYNLDAIINLVNAFSWAISGCTIHIKNIFNYYRFLLENNYHHQASSANIAQYNKPFQKVIDFVCKFVSH